VRAGHEQMWPGQSGLGGDEAASFVEDDLICAEKVADHEGKPGFAVVENEAAGVELVVHVISGEGAEAANDGGAERWGDVTSGCASEELLRILGDPGGREDDEKQENPGDIAHDGGMRGERSS
jgi:hypothetical protein